MKLFDVILVNPPFRNNDGSSTKTAPGGGTRNLFSKFASQYTDLVKQDGYIFAVTPPGLFKTTNTNRSNYLNHLNNYNFYLNYINLNENDNHFRVGTPICSWLASSKKSNITVISGNDQIELSESISYIPVVCNTTSISIRDKMHNLHNSVNLNLIRDRKPSTFKGGISFGSLLSGNNKLKVFTDNSILHKSGCLSLECNNPEQYKILFESKLFKFWFVMHRYNGSIYRIFMNLIKIPKDLPNIKSDLDIYNMYNLTQEEINYIENAIK